MATTLIRDAVLISGLFTAGIFAFLYRDNIYEYAGLDPQFISAARASAKAKQLGPEQAKPTTQPVSQSYYGYSAVISKSADGQYWADALVNNTQVKLLVDTGASVVVLTPKDAKKAGLRPSDLDYNAPMNTAAGKVMAAHAEIASLSVGNVTVHNVKAVVIPKGLTHSLLGMSYLGELRKMEVASSELTLHQ